MSKQRRLLVVDDTVIPEIVDKVLEAKTLLSKGQAKNTTEAIRKLGLSRSTYYKYKDHVFVYNEGLSDGLLNLYAILEDEPGVLSNFISALYRHGANILTVNQNLPVDGVAVTTLTVRIHRETFDEAQFTARLREVAGVVELRILTGV